MSLAELGQLPLLDLSTTVDVVIIIWGIISILMLGSIIIAVTVLALSVRRLIHEVNDLVNTGVRPVVGSARETVDNVTGTTRFVGDRVVTPFIRVMSIVAGLRHGVAVFSGLSGRRERSEEEM